VCNQRAVATVTDVRLSNQWPVASEWGREHATFERIAAPTLVLNASDDPMAPYENAWCLAERIPGPQLVALASGGHLMLGQVVHRCRAIRLFLREHAPTRRGREG